MIEQFLVGTAPILTFYPPEGLADASPTLTISDDGGTLWTGSPETIAQASSPSTTLSADANEGAVTLSVADGSSFVPGRRYLVSRANGIKFEVTVRAKTSTTLELDDALSEKCLSGDTIRDWAVRRTLTTTETALVKRNIKALYKYLVNGESLSYEQRFDIVKAPFYFAITEQDIREKAPDWNSFKSRTANWRPLIKAAHDDIDQAIRLGGLYPDRIAHRDILKSAVVNALLARIHRGAGSPLESSYRDDMTTNINSILGSKNRYDNDDTGTDTSGDSYRLPAVGHTMPLV